jgi:2-polyprenyl-3-methyl-5-hydroxy-6-metoxy-1,4-benzoquinol methylase
VNQAVDPGEATLRLYRGTGLGARFHVRIRWSSCPFRELAAVIPTRSRVLEVGCGHGLLAAYLALESSDRKVRGIDIDHAKIAVARAAGRRARRLGADLDFAAESPGSLLPGPWDAIVMVDVLYLLQEAEQRSLIEACARLLAPGGALVVKEMGPSPRWKFLWNRVQETLSVRVLGITQGGSLTFLGPDRLERVMRAQSLATASARVDRGYPHPHHLLVGRRSRE